MYKNEAPISGASSARHLKQAPKAVFLLIVASQAQRAAVKIHNQVMADGRGCALRTMNVMARSTFHRAGSAAALQHRGAENSANLLQLRILGRGIHIIDADGVHEGEAGVTG